MANYIVKRIILAFFTTAMISVLSFVVIQLPAGDYVDWYVEDLMQKACDITKAGIERILGFVKPGVWEYEIEAELIHEFIRNKIKEYL